MAGRRQLTEAERDVKQQEIMRVVEQIFASHHPNDLLITMETIARKAKLAKGTLYLYFKTKEDLIFKTYIKSLQIKHDKIVEHLLKFDSPLNKYEAFLNYYYQFFIQYPEYLSIQMYCESGGFIKQKILASTQEKYIQVARSTSALLMDIIQACVDDGSFKADLNVELTHFNSGRALRGIIFFCLFTFERHHLSVQNKCTAEEFYNNFIKIMLDGMKA